MLRALSAVVIYLKGKQKKVMRVVLYLMGVVLLLGSTLSAYAATPKKSSARSTKKQAAKRTVPAAISRDPYIGAVVVDATNGQVLFADNADGRGYPASVIKLMDLLIILEKVQRGTIKLTDRVTVTAEAAKVGGSQAYLKAKEVFSLDELLYALMVKSANDVAAALAIHVAGSQEAFVELMNRKARELGMTATRFQSVHGLPPRRGQAADESTPRDLSVLARAVLKLPETLRYTSTKYCSLRNGTFMMGNHNHLLGVVEGCDGLKTGYFARAGFSIVATAERKDTRIIAVVLGSQFRQTRDRKARELLAQGFVLLPMLPPPEPAITAAVAVSPAGLHFGGNPGGASGPFPWIYFLLVGGGAAGGSIITLTVFVLRQGKLRRRKVPDRRS